MTLRLLQNFAGIHSLKKIKHAVLKSATTNYIWMQSMQSVPWRQTLIAPGLLRGKNKEA